MIIAITGSTQQDVNELALGLSEDRIQVIDTLDLLRRLDRKSLNNLTTNRNLQKSVLKSLENAFESVIITGNIVVNEEICEWLLSNNNIVVVTTRKSIDSYDPEVLEQYTRFWDDKVSLQYNLTVRFQSEYERLKKIHKKVYMADLSEPTDESEELFETVSQIKSSRKDNDMTIEESIKKAMAELGMDVDTSSSEPEQPQKKVEKTKSQAKKSTKVKPEPIMNPPEEVEPEEKEEEPVEESLFVKVTNNSMAILIPESLKLEQQEISGIKFNVATVELPDLSSRKLQELSILSETSKSTENAKTAKSVVRTPIKSKGTEKPKSVSKGNSDGSLDELHEEKARLDAEIKKYRAQGDIETVNALRKQRRAVRNKINSLK